MSLRGRVLALALLGCSSRGMGPEAAQADHPAEWGSGIVRHDEHLPNLLSGPGLGEPQALAAGQWDDPRQMWEANCGRCHHQGVGPPLLGEELPRPYVVYVGRNGLRAMPPSRQTDYTDAEMVELATWIADQPSPEPPPATMDAEPTESSAAPPPLDPGVSPSTSEEIYRIDCARCHEQGAPPLLGKNLQEGYVLVVARHGLRRMPAYPESMYSDAQLLELAEWMNEQSP